MVIIIRPNQTNTLLDDHQFARVLEAARYGCAVNDGVDRETLQLVTVLGQEMRECVKQAE